MTLNENFDLRDQGTSNAEQTVDFARHRWYYYKEGFSPNLVKRAIEQQGLSNGDYVIDPFNGSGTVTLAAASEGVKSIGYEVNPFTNFLARTKSLTANKRQFQKEVLRTKDICSSTNSPSHLEGYSTFSSNANNSKWLFNTEVLRAFNAGYQEHKNSRSNVSSLIKLALISAAMQNCNAKKDGKCLRYKSNWEQTDFSRDSFLNSLEGITDKILEDIDTHIDVKPKTINGDSRRLLSKLDSKFSLCVTSPPYLNTFDYTDIYRPELFLGEFVNSSDDLYKLRLKTLRSHIQANWKKPVEDQFGSLYKDVFDKISAKPESLMHKNIPSMITAYFEDMKNVLATLKTKAKPGASVWLIVSTSAYANEHVPVDLILADIGDRVGWKLKDIGVLREIQKRKTKHSPDIDTLRESVIIFNS